MKRALLEKYSKTLLGNIALLLGMSFLLVSCMPEGREGLPLIDDPSRNASDSRFCRASTTLEAVATGDTSVCFNRCPEGTEPANTTQMQDLEQDINDSNNTQETKDFLFEMIEEASVVCFPEEIVRPDESVFVRRNFCACIDREPDVVNDCVNFCQNKTNNQSRLFGEVSVGPDIELNSQLQNLHGWCNNEIEGSDQVSPSCVLEFWSEDGGEPSVQIQTFPGSNRFEANISSLSYDKTYIAQIVETGSNASSDSFQVRRYRFGDSDTDTSMPLKIMPTSQYTCLDRTGECGQIQDEDEFYLCARRQYYYFASNSEPPAMPPGENFVVCHDLAMGENDNELFPRFELRPQHLAMWDQTDIRFVDQSGDGRPDINQKIQDRLVEEFNEQRDVNVFGLFQWPNRPGSGQVNVGFYMQPWIDQTTGRGFCPGINEYQGNDNLFKILGELIGVETEGLYLAVQQAEGFNDDGSPIESILLIRENLLKQIWFYYQDGQHFVPDATTAGQRTIRFYWPPDTNTPYQKKAYQRLFTIRSPDELSGANTSGLQTNVRPPDKRIGCLPAVD